MISKWRPEIERISNPPARPVQQLCPPQWGVHRQSQLRRIRILGGGDAWDADVHQSRSLPRAMIQASKSRFGTIDANIERCQHLDMPTFRHANIEPFRRTLLSSALEASFRPPSSPTSLNCSGDDFFLPCNERRLLWVPPQRGPFLHLSSFSSRNDGKYVPTGVVSSTHFALRFNVFCHALSRTPVVAAPVRAYLMGPP